MKHFITFILLSVVWFLVACQNAPEAKPIVVVSESATTRTIEHTFGTTEIPINPQRVIALGEEALLADLLDIGIQPVASIVNETEHLPLISAEELAGTELYRSAGQTSLETLLAFNPDLIIGTVFFVNEAGYEQLADIAPTVAVGGNNPLDMYTETVAVFGLRDQAEAEVAAFRAEVAAVAAEINASEQEISVAAVYGGPNLALFFGGPQAPPYLLNEMGVTMLPVGEEREALRMRNGRAFISEERLDLISGERLILLQAASVEGEMEDFEALTNDPLWQQLPAVQAGNVTILDRLGYPGFWGQKALLANLAQILGQDN